ncbi:DsrE family protein [Thermithiobacillus tepidarius DSM 3134]|uniref:DsrE family protein n=1 Tax=Thermithiobacillus tepidarius TaxID=929 RepID=UPI000421877E|nr:DsrE family protein [Thermithiobacillus tepidarius]
MKNMMARVALVLWVALMSFSLQAQAQDSAPAQSPENFKLLLEVNSASQESWHGAISTARQVMTTIGMDKAQIEVVAWGPGIKMLLKNSPVAENIQSLSMYGIKFLACNNTMKAMKIQPTDLAEGVTIIPAAVVHIVQRDHEGWTQIKM